MEEDSRLNGVIYTQPPLSFHHPTKQNAHASIHPPIHPSTRASYALFHNFILSHKLQCLLVYTTNRTGVN